MIKNTKINFVVTAKYYNRLPSADVFACALEESLLLIRAILLTNPELQKEPPTSMTFTHPTVDSGLSRFDCEMYEEFDQAVFGY